MTQLGRITGPLLEANLNRNGQDLSFRNYSANDDILYLNNGSSKVNINTNGSYDLNVNSFFRTTNLTTNGQANIANFAIDGSSFTTTTGPINIFPEVHMARMQVADLDFIGNQIRNKTPNGSIFLVPNGAGIVDIQGSSKINGDLSVLGKITVNGNLGTQSRIIIGDSIYDTVTVNTDFTQDIIPGNDVTYDLGKANKRWRNAFIHSDAHINNLVQTTITVSDQVFINGPTASIHTLQSNDQLLINPTTGITRIERIQIQDDAITNLDSVPLVFGSTGIGYVRFMDNSAVVIPAGTNAERPDIVEAGMTRWNTDQDYLECFDGTVWQVATGGGATVTVEDMQDLGNLYSLILG